MLEEIEFHRLAKLRLEVDEPEELSVSKISIMFTALNKWTLGTPTDDCLRTKNRMIALQLKPNVPFSWWIVSNIIPLHLMIP